MPAPLDISPLGDLINAKNRQAVDTFLCACAREATLGDSQPTNTRVAEIAALFELSDQKARAMQGAGVAMIREAMYPSASREQVEALFPADFNEKLRSLILLVYEHRAEQWREESLRDGGISALPLLHGSTCQVYRKPSTKGTAPTVLVGLQLDQTGGHQLPAASDSSGNLHIELSSEQLDAMLQGLAKIKSQLASV